jgi:hypothetical protein
MNLIYRRLDPKSRRLLQIANTALVVGLLPRVFHEYIPFNHNWVDAFCGFFIGLSITVNLFCLRAARRCRSAGSGVDTI